MVWRKKGSSNSTSQVHIHELLQITINLLRLENQTNKTVFDAERHEE